MCYFVFSCDFLFQASQYLAEYLLHNQELMKDKWVHLRTNAQKHTRDHVRDKMYTHSKWFNEEYLWDRLVYIYS